jgi:hypothetical protein
VSGERIGGVPCAFVRRLGVVGVTHLLSWVVSALWQGQSPRGALLGNYRAVPRAVVALPHCPEDGSGPRSTRLDIGEQKRDNPRRSPAYREGVNMTKPPCPRAVRPRVALRRNNIIRPILSCANALYPIAYASPPSTRPIRTKSHRSTTNRRFAAPGRLKLSSTVARSLNRLRLHRKNHSAQRQRCPRWTAAAPPPRTARRPPAQLRRPPRHLPLRRMQTRRDGSPVGNRLNTRFRPGGARIADRTTALASWMSRCSCASHSSASILRSNVVGAKCLALSGPIYDA